MLKCLKCPYKLGLIKYATDPFPEAEIKEEIICKSKRH